MNPYPITDSLSLSRVKRSDAPAIQQWLNEREMFNNTLRIPFPYQLDDARERIRMNRRFERRHRQQMDWAIRDEEGQLIGMIGRHYQYGMYSHRDEIGYWLARPYWGQGVMTTVIRKFCQMLFETTNLIRLEATVFEHNEASIRVLVKTGFQQEGFMRKAFLKEGRPLNGLLLALLKEEE